MKVYKVLSTHDGPYQDLHGDDIVTCSSAKRAKELVKAARPSCVVRTVKLLGLS